MVTKPYDFVAAADAATANPRLQLAVSTAVGRQDAQRRLRLADLPNADRLRDLAAQIKQHTLDHLDFYLEQLRDSVHRNGGHVHLVSTADQATQLILDIARTQKCTRVIKSKSMVSEEIELAHSLESAGLDVVETDLGEFIVQIDQDKPSHLVTPIIHKDRQSIGRLFSRYFHTPYTDDPAALTQQARLYLRKKFRHADLGLTGGNFLVAESGHVCVVENEGNARQSVTTPRVLISLVGIEKVVPRLVDLAVMLKLLARSATGQPMTVYTNLFGGPRSPGERDGPREFHLILLDNGRSEILAGEYRETLCCIRCGACLNACPVYRKIGGHAYGSVYPGPIGALITPLMRGLANFPDLPQASSLCGACVEACPVKIDIPRHLVNLRRDLVQQKLNSPLERLTYRLWALALQSPLAYALLSRAQRRILRPQAGPWIIKLPRLAAGWTKVRDLPAPAPRSFHQLWRDRETPHE